MRGFVTTADLADELGVRPETVVRYIREHKIDADYREGRYFIPVDEAGAFATAYLNESDEDEREEGDPQEGYDESYDWDKE